MSCSGVFEDMENETLDLLSICFGPFPQRVNNLDVTISTLQQDIIKQIFSWKKWEEVNQEFKTEQEMKKYKEVQVIPSYFSSG